MTDQNTHKPLLLTAADLAGEMSVSVRSVFRMSASRKLPAHVCVGQRRRWRRSEILLWIDAGCPTREEWEQQRGGAR